MRNLQLLSSRCVPDAVPGAQCTSIDYDTKVLYAAADNGLVTAFDPITCEAQNETSISSYLGPEGGGGHVVGIQHLPDQMAVCVATSVGHLLLWNPAAQDEEVAEMGCVDSGIEAMSWSPDHEVLVIATGQRTLIIMTREFDPVTEVPIESTQFGDGEFITVGWGKKETQFHGSAGKQAATVKQQEVKPALEMDDMQTRITWRGDGVHFATTSVDVQTGARCVRVWSREGELHSTSENVDGLEQSLAWKPSGSLLASSQRRPNRHQIAFFEKNGLRHGEFTLPFGVNEVKVREVSWNSESTVLAVWLEELHKPDAAADFCPKSWVQLYTVNNYHWYLKQSLAFPDSVDDRVACLNWDPEHGYCLHIVCAGGKYLQYTWSWATARSVCQDENSEANVAVIDGANVLLSPCRGMVVPPPLSAYSLQLPVPVHHVAFSSANDDMAVTLSDGRIALYSFDGSKQDETRDPSVKLGACGGNGFSLKCKTPHCKGIYSLEGIDGCVSYSPISVYHVTWLSGDSVLLCASNSMGDATTVHRAQIQEDRCAIVSRWQHETEGQIVGVSANLSTGNVALQTSTGALLRYHSDSIEPWSSEGNPELQFPQMCIQMAVCQIDKQEVVLGLTERFRFYVNDVEVASNCTSFVVHNEFLLLTTHSHTLRCISRHTKLHALPSLADGKEHPFDESVRRVERGSRLVTVVPHDTRVLLQMPRGNLETLHPRALVLSAVRQHLDGLNFSAAFVLMRKHRINMNLLYDHCPATFLDNVDKFLDQVSAVNHINLFLTDLQEEDVTLTMYTAAYTRTAPSRAASSDSLSKVDTVCNAVREALEKKDGQRYFLSILTAYVRKSTPELDTALLRIKALKDNPSSVGTSGAGSVSAEDALKYLVFLVDVNELYDVALGTYDFQLVLLVADKSQKDPKEYIPFLNELRKLEENYQKYSIDKHLKRYASALTHITKCGPDHFMECLDLVKSHKLYTEALALYSCTSQEYKDLAVAYGHYLVEKRRFEEAGIMFSLAEEHTEALSAYRECQNWRMALCVAGQLKYTPEQTANLARKIADKLKEQQKSLEAACLLELYAEDPEEAIVTVIEGGEWEEALRLMYKHGRLDFIETNLKSSLVESYELHMVSIQEAREQFDRYNSRLGKVRQEKERKRLEILESGDINRPDSDLFSDTSSATGESVISRGGASTADSNRSTIFSKATGNSRKARRKHEKKKWSLKEGSAHEDIALIEALSKLVKQLDQYKPDVHKLLRMLVQFRYQQEAETLQRTYDAALKVVETALPEIWDPEKTQEVGGASATGMSFGPDATANTIALAMQQQSGAANSGTGDTIQEPWLKTAPTLNKDIRWKLHITDPSSER